LEDIAHGLAYKFRYAGQVTPITGAEHALMVEDIIRLLWPSIPYQLAGLLHDSCQAYTQDIQTPVRKFVKVQLPNGDIIPWSTLESKMNGVIAKALHLPARFWAAPEVKAANIIAVAIEKEQCPVLQRSGSWGLPDIPVEVSHLEMEFIAPAVAKQRFLDRYAALTA